MNERNSGWSLGFGPEQGVNYGICHLLNKETLENEQIWMDFDHADFEIGIRQLSGTV